MVFRSVVGPVVALGICLLFASSAHAQCSKDVDCKGDRVCEEGACVSPPAPAALPPAPPAPNGAAPVAGGAPAQAAPAPVAAPAALAPVNDTSVARAVPTTQRHNSGMMAVGIVMVSVGPLALLAAMVTSFNKADCENYDPLFEASGSSRGSNCGRYNTPLYVSLLSGVGLIGAGIPMIVIGGKREPVGTARLTPWASPHGAGLGLRVDL